MSRAGGMVLIGMAMSLAGCGPGTPATVDEVIAKQREELATEGQNIVWIGATPGEEPGKFTVIADRREGEKPESEVTLICDVSQTSNSSTRVCSSADPSILNGARIGLLESYKGRNIKVHELTLARTGKGNAFAGRIVLDGPGKGQTSAIPCRGDQDGENYTADCRIEWAAEEAAKAEGGKPAK